MVEIHLFSAENASVFTSLFVYWPKWSCCFIVICGKKVQKSDSFQLWSSTKFLT